MGAVTRPAAETLGREDDAIECPAGKGPARGHGAHGASRTGTDGQMSDSRVAMAAAGCIGLLLSPGVRDALLASMTLQMNVQLPLLMICGAAVIEPWRSRLSTWTEPVNRHGLTGLLLGGGIASVWMVPRALDAAVAYGLVDALKVVSLLLAGALLRLSWRPAGPTVQGFFVGNAVWMSATVGLLIAQSTDRLCNAYLQSDQQTAGFALLLLAGITGLTWIFCMTRSMQKDKPDVASSA